MDKSETEIMTNVLLSIKKLLGITPEYIHFDEDILIHINSVLLELSQLGVSLPNDFSVDDKTLWIDIFQEGILLSAIRSFVYLKVRLLFDPPANSAAIESINKTIANLEWRINGNIDYEQKEENKKI